MRGVTKRSSWEGFIVRFAFGIFTLVLCLSAPLLVYANAEIYESRLSDPLYRTGERFAIVVENHAKQNIALKVHFDPGFFMASTMGRGLLHAPTEAVAYKVFHRRLMGVPKFETERSESLPDEDHLRYNRQVFAELPGAKIDPEIKFSITGPGRSTCINVLPHVNVPLKGARIPLSYMNVDASLPTVSVIYVTIPPKGDQCLAQFHVPGDMSWLDGGHPPAHLLPQPAVVVEEPVYAITPFGHFILQLGNNTLQFAGLPAQISGAGLVLNYADVALTYEESRPVDEEEDEPGVFEPTPTPEVVDEEAS